MIDRLISLSLEKRVLVLFGVVVLIALGVQSFVRLPIDAFPDVTNIQVEVLSNAPGLSPLEVEKFVTHPVEMTIRGVPRLARSPVGLQVRALRHHGRLRGRRGHLLRPGARPRAPHRGPGEGPGGRRDRHGAGLDGHGGDLPVHARRAGDRRVPGPRPPAHGTAHGPGLGPLADAQVHPGRQRDQLLRGLSPRDPDRRRPG